MFSLGNARARKFREQVLLSRVIIIRGEEEWKETNVGDDRAMMTIF